MSGEMRREAGIYFARSPVTGKRYAVQVFEDADELGRLTLFLFGSESQYSLRDFTDYAKAIDPLAKEPQG